jgi:ABC-2 type transport system ATP-binding protein|tara:strand:- start:60609 stop:61550 length:942 start_codon:yes stop_codon:yes gene_type:complete
MTAALSISNLDKTYNNGFEALKGIDLRVEQGDFFALLGPNGAGKSTIISILCSLTLKSSGAVKIFATDIDENFAKAKQNIGIVPQEFNFNSWEKVFDIVVTQGGYYGMPLPLAKERAEKYLKKLGLWEKRGQSSRTLSGGMKRRLMIARALVHEPRLLILDEPTAGVDIELRRSMWAFLREINASGTTIILTTHYLEEAESLCRNVAIIDQGRIIRNSSMKNLLRELNKETFIMDFEEEFTSPPALDGYAVRLSGTSSLEVVVEKGKPLNGLFKLLDAQGLLVCSMRNKSNRLEEMFVSMVETSKASQEEQVK